MSDRKIAFVTGANKGIGLEIARQLGRADVTILVGARDIGRGQAAANTLRAEGLDVHEVELDITAEASANKCAEFIGKRFDRLDILINNAGMNDAEDGPPTKGGIDAARRLMETNFLGALAVSQAMVPLLRKSSAASIVNISSSLGSLAGNGDRSSPYYAARLIGYNASKAALNMLTVQLAEELRETNIIVNSVCPGFVKTDLNGHTGYLSVVEAASTPVRLALLRHNRVTGLFLSAEGEVAW